MLNSSLGTHENCENSLRSLSTFAAGDPQAYMRSYKQAARVLSETTRKTLEWNSLCCVLVLLYRHSIELTLKQLTVAVARLLGKTVTANHIRTIGRFSMCQLWSSVAAMLEQLGAAETPGWRPEWELIETSILQLGTYDADFSALCSLSGHAQHRRNSVCTAEIEQSSIELKGHPELIGALERLSDNLSDVEEWISEQCVPEAGKNRGKQK